MGRRLSTTIAAGLAAGSLAAFAPSAEATIPQGNLIQNPGAEASPGVPNDTSHICPASWGCANNATAVHYGTSLFPSLAEGARIGGGENFFAGGPDDAVAEVQQQFDFSAAGPEIDAGGVQATLSACLGGFQDQDDYVFLSLEERDGSNLVLTSEGVTGPKASVRGGQTTLLPESTTFQVPSNTRSASLRVSFQRQGLGTYDDGYADNISFTLGPFPGTAPPATPCAAPPAGQVAPRKRCKKHHKGKRHAAESKKHKKCKKHRGKRAH